MDYKMFKKRAVLSMLVFLGSVLFVVLFMYAQERWGWGSNPIVQAEKLPLSSPEGEKLAVKSVYFYGQLLGVKTFVWGDFAVFPEYVHVKVIKDPDDANLGTHVEVNLFRPVTQGKDLIDDSIREDDAWWVKEMTIFVRTSELKEQWDSALKKKADDYLNGKSGLKGPRDIAPPPDN